MIEAATALHYLAVVLSIIFPVLGVGLGQGRASGASVFAVNRQPAIRNALNRFFFIAIALTETASVLGTLFGVILFLNPQPDAYGALVEVGAALGIGLPAGLIGYVSAAPARAAFAAMARQPQGASKIANLLLISQSLLQTPVIFGLVLGWLLNQSVGQVHSLPHALQLFSAGITLAFGSLGGIKGLSRFSKAACESCGSAFEAYPRILSFSFISQAMIETPILFTLVAALLLVFTPFAPADIGIAGTLAYVCSAFACALPACSTGYNSGTTAQRAVESIARNPEAYATIARCSIIGQTLIDTNGIYGLIIAIALIYFV